MRPWLVTRILTALLLLLTGACTYSASEPGLFNDAPVEEAPLEDSSPPPPRPLEPTNPQLPVAAESVWTSSEGLGIPLRFAIHAVRRMSGATALDWSVTPLATPDLSAGTRLPSWVDLNLSRVTGGDAGALLVDGQAGRVYRPLQHRSRREFNHCLCTPLWVAKLDLRVGETRLLQTTFPPLPATTSFVDITMATLPVFGHIAVSAEGQVPTARQPVDLTRPPERTRPLAPPYRLREQQGRAPEREQNIEIEAVEAGEHYTAMRWTIRSVTDQPSFAVLPPGPPIAAAVPNNLEQTFSGSASGPLLRAGSTTLGVRWITTPTRLRRAIECLCTNLGLWAPALREAGGWITVTSVYPALPPGTTGVDVVLPTAATLRGLPVVAAPESATRTGPSRPAQVERWVYSNDRPPAGWATSAWPTPLPDLRSLPDYGSRVESFTSPPAS